jgi:hypothetical protein
MSVLAAIRPDSWNFPLLVHVFGAMVLVGGLFTSAGILATARRDTGFLRLGYWALLAVALPGWIVMRIGAQWIYSKEGWGDFTAFLPEGSEPAWLGIGGMTADAGGLILLVSVILGGFGMRRTRDGGSSGLLKATLVLSVILLAAYVVAVWAMAGKPD